MSAHPKMLARKVRENMGGDWRFPVRAESLAALVELERRADDPFLRYRDSITETLKFISTHAGSGDYSQVIADMATELLGDLGVE